MTGHVTPQLLETFGWQGSRGHRLGDIIELRGQAMVIDTCSTLIGRKLVFDDHWPKTPRPRKR